MNRELNPQLFGSRTTVEKIGNPVDPYQPAPSIMGKGGEAGAAQNRAVPYASIDVKALEQQISALKVGLMQMEKRTELMATKIEDVGRSVHSRLERFWTAITRLEENQKETQQDTTGKIMQIVAKVNERRVVDQKVQELIDRHNAIIRNFENRMMSLQRLVTEQEHSLHNSHAALEEARAEIARLKRL